MARPMIMVTGGAPGLGKSSLVQWLVERLPSVSSFDEADILIRPEFAEVIAMWRRGDVPTFDLLAAATDSYLGLCRSETAEVFVQDALLPYLPSLYAWGYQDEQIRRWFERLAHAAREDVELIQIHLSGDAVPAIARAAAREGDGWLDRMVERASNWAEGDEVVDLESLALLCSNWDARSRRLLRDAPWRVLTVDADTGQSDVERRVADLLTVLLDRVGSRGPTTSSDPDRSGTPRR